MRPAPATARRAPAGRRAARRPAPTHRRDIPRGCLHRADPPIGDRSMTPAAAATAVRVLRQLRRDRRTMALLLAVPVVLLALVRFVINADGPVFDRFGLPLVGIFPLVSMFLVTSIAVLRERMSGTLERLLTLPLTKLDILAGYGAAFALVA